MGASYGALFPGAATIYDKFTCDEWNVACTLNRQTTYVLEAINMQQELVRTIAKWNTKAPTKGHAHKYLQPFAGEWKVEGKNFSNGESSNVTGVESYEWLTGGYFLVNRFERDQGDDKFSGIGWIGFDAANGAYLSYSISNIGYFRIYQVQITPNEICYLGTSERGVVRLAEGGNTMTIRWEQMNGAGKWQPLCELTGHRIN